MSDVHGALLVLFRPATGCHTGPHATNLRHCTSQSTLALALALLDAVSVLRVPHLSLAPPEAVPHRKNGRDQESDPFESRKHNTNLGGGADSTTADRQLAEEGGRGDPGREPEDLGYKLDG